MARIKYAQPLSKRIGRRRFAQASGIGLICAPFVSILRGREAQAAPGDAKRLLLWLTHGTRTEMWRMTGATPTSIATTPWNVGLDRIKDKIVVAEGLAGGGGHSSRHSLTGRGWTNDFSVDQVVAQHLNPEGGANNTPIPSLLLGAAASSASGGGSKFIRNGLLPTNDDPLAAYSLALGGVTPAPGGGEMPMADMLGRKQSMLDTAIADLQELYGVLGSQERPKLDAHLASLRQFEERLSNPASVSGCEPVPPMQSDNHVAIGVTMLDLAVQALSCDVTRVVGVQWGTDHDAFQIKLDLPSGRVEQGLHGIEHNFGNRETEWREFEAYISERFADLVLALDATEDVIHGGTMLDNTLVVWARMMGDSTSHGNDDQRFVYAGGPSILNLNPEGTHIEAGGGDYEQGLFAITDALGVPGAQEMLGDNDLGALQGVLA